MSEQTQPPVKAEVYCFLVDDEGHGIWIVEKSFWEAEHRIKDTSFDGKLSSILPSGFTEEAESCFALYERSGKKGYPKKSSLKKARKLLLDAGFTEVFW